MAKPGFAMTASESKLWSLKRGPPNLHPERLSASVGDLHRAGDSRAGTARLCDQHRLAALPDRQARAPGAPRDRGQGQLSAGVSVPGAGARVAFVVEGAFPPGLRPRLQAVAEGSGARPD